MSYDPYSRTTPELLRDWAAAMRVLKERGVVRTNNNPVGDIAEAVVAEHYGGKRGGFAQPGWDVETPDGQKIQVKGVRQTATNNRVKAGAIRDSDYHFVVLVIFDEDFLISEGLVITREAVEDLTTINTHVNGRQLALTNKLRADPRVTTVDLRPAAARLHGDR